MASLKPYVLLIFLVCFGPFFCTSVPIGAGCSKNEDCDGYPESTVCDDLLKACICNDEHVLVRGDGNKITCERIRNEIGEPCLVSDQCQMGTPGKLSDCIPSLIDQDQLICNCTDGNINQPGEHVCHEIRNLIGDPCEVDAQCSFHLTEWAQCSLDDKECSCKPGSINTMELNKCLEIRDKLGLECEIAEQCFLGEPGFLSNCMEPYDQDDDEETGSGKICNCTEIAINEPDEHHCYMRRDKLGQQCDRNAQCKVNMGDLSECDEKDTRCVCRENVAVANNANNFCLEIINEIGGECTESQQCTAGIPGDLSICRGSFEDENKMVCNCTDEAINEPGKDECLRKANIVGEECKEEAQCTANLGGLSECYAGDNGICRCKDGTISRENGTLCLAIRQELGETCEENRQCQSGIPGEFSICDEGKCECNSGSTNEPGQNRCLARAVEIGGVCQANMQCKANLGSLSECLGGRCSCTVDYGVGNKFGNFCIPIINFIGVDCQEDVQCMEGVPGEFSGCLGSNVLPGVKICNCSDGALHEIGRHKCYKIAERIGGDCDILEQCQVGLGDLAECVGGKEKVCQCVEGRAVGNLEGNKCLEIVDKVGGHCEENGQCVEGVPGELSECGKGDEWPFEDICKCRDTAVKHPGNERCLRKGNYVGDRCEVDLQCMINIGNLTECGKEEGFCSCKEGAVGNEEGIRNTKCIPGGILIGNGCFDKAQCVGEMDRSSTCHLGICGCLDGYTESIGLDDCLKVVDRLGEECVETQQCQQGRPGEWSECRGESEIGGGRIKVCRCNDDATSEAGRDVCYKKAEMVGDTCERNVQCVANLEQSQCLNGRCVCLGNSAVTEKGDKCLSKKDLNEGCEDNNQCRDMDHVTCRVKEEEGDDDEKICRCDEGYMDNPVKGNSCMEKAVSIGDSCEEDKSQCDFLIGAICRVDLTPKVCGCREGEEVVGEDEKSCLKAVWDLHEKCEEGGQCQVNNSVCGFDAGVEDNACICGDDFVETGDGKCLEVRSDIGQDCEDTKQCDGIGQNVECILDKCRCKTPFADFENRCYIPSKLGQDCNRTEQCYLGVNKLAICNQPWYKCSCVDGAYQDGDLCLATKVVGDSCENDKECSNTIIGPVLCSRYSNTCTCEDGYSADTGGIRCSGAFSINNMRESSVFYLIGLIWSVVLLK